MLKAINTALLWILLSVSAYAQQHTLYSKAYGKPTDPAIVFLHGGPGYNSAGFEITTAQRLADEGYYVVVYDQRGCARSKGFADSTLTLAGNLADLDSIYCIYHLKSATLMGHSWGGTLATFYYEGHKDRVKRMILVSSPISYGATFSTMLRHCKEFYTAKNDTNALAFLEKLGKADTTSLMYASSLFIHAFACKLYSPKQPTEERTAIMTKAKTDPDFKFTSQNDQKPVQGLYKDIHHTMLNTSQMLNKLKPANNIYGIYGTDDGLFGDKQLNDIKNITTSGHFYLVQNASHNVFIDQQAEFIADVNKIMK